MYCVLVVVLYHGECFVVRVHCLMYVCWPLSSLGVHIPSAFFSLFRFAHRFSVPDAISPSSSTLAQDGQQKAKKNARNRYLGRRVFSETHMSDLIVRLPCSLEELAARMLHPETGVPTRHRKYRRKTYRNCFTGLESPLLCALALCSASFPLSLFVFFFLLFSVAFSLSIYSVFLLFCSRSPLFLTGFIARSLF